MARGRTRRAAAAPCPSAEVLPAEVLRAVLSRMPADARARAACVSRAWRAAAADPGAWTELDLTAAAGLTCSVHVTSILFCLGERLTQLRVLRVPAEQEALVSQPLPGFALHAVLLFLRSMVRRGSPAAALTEIHVTGVLELSRGNTLRVAENEALLRGLLAEAPTLQVLALDRMECTSSLGVAVLSMPAVRVRHVSWLLSALDRDDSPAVPPVVLLQVLKESAPLTGLTVQEPLHELTNALLSPVVDLALERHLVSLRFEKCCLHFDSAAMKRLARLLRDSRSLRRLCLDLNGRSRYSTNGVELFADALRASTTLTHFTLGTLAYSWPHVGPTVLSALVGHPSIRSLMLWEHWTGGPGIDLSWLDASLGRLLRADALALERLELHFEVESDGQPPLTLPRTFDALADNTHLRALKIGALDGASAFVQTKMVPALRANSRLREAYFHFVDGAMDASFVFFHVSSTWA